jgi:predicted CopG family antitoxin
VQNSYHRSRRIDGHVRDGSLSEEAYERLAAHKRADETFSDVVLRLAGERSLLELAGILDDDEAEELREAVAERRR